MERNKNIPGEPHSTIWIPSNLKNGLVLKTIEDGNRYISITLAKVLKSAGVAEIDDKALERLLKSNEKKSIKEEAIVAAK